MANTAVLTQTDNAPNYLGAFFVLGANQTPLLNMLGNLNGYRPVIGFNFPVSVYASLETAAQTVVTEDAAIAGNPTPETYVKAQAYNVIQTMWRGVSVSYAKLSDKNKLSGIYYTNMEFAKQAELDFQTEMALKQLAVDTEFSLFKGLYAARTDSSSSAATRGFIGSDGTNGAIQTNAIAGGTAALTTTMVDAMVKAMADSGAPFSNPVIFCNSWQKQKLSNLYGWSPIAAPGAGLGGTAVERIETDFGVIPVVFAPKMLTTAIACIEMDEVKLAGLEVPGKGAIFLEALGKLGAADRYQLYAQFGLDYGEESHHGCINALTIA